MPELKHQLSDGEEDACCQTKVTAVGWPLPQGLLLLQVRKAFDEPMSICSTAPEVDPNM